EISTESSNAKKKNNSPSNEATSRRQPSPSSEEIDEFFKEAEKYQHKRFVEKYNFDIVKDVPVEGRYEWVKLK
ncbi:cyclin-dependent kinase inhibitor 7-like protein, partial [Tanacetum coccineum]